MRVNRQGRSIFSGLALLMLILVAACGEGKSASQTAVAQTAVRQTAEEATRVAPTKTPTPTATPLPTNTPVPTATAMKISTQDDKSDCEVITGFLDEGGCQVDVKAFEMLPCENPGLYTFQVDFYRIMDPLSTNVCFLINGDGNKETGFENEGFIGVDWDYCWLPETGDVVVSIFDEIGNLVEASSITNPLHFVSVDPGDVIQTDPFWMTFPPTEFREFELLPNAEAVVQTLFYDQDETMIFDGSPPILLSSCPSAE
jgi:hypothetical protein